MLSFKLSAGMDDVTTETEFLSIATSSCICEFGRKARCSSCKPAPATSENNKEHLTITCSATDMLSIAQLIYEARTYRTRTRVL